MNGAEEVSVECPNCTTRIRQLEEAYRQHRRMQAAIDLSVPELEAAEASWQQQVADLTEQLRLARQPRPSLPATPTHLWLGLAKVHLERLHNYAGKAQVLMVAWLFFRDPSIPWHWWYLPVGLLGVGLLIWVDHRYIIPAELEQCMRLNPMWMSFLQQQKPAA